MKRNNPQLPSLQKMASQIEHDTLSRLFRDGQIVDAENLAKSLTKRFEGDGFSWKVLGVIYQNQYRYKESADASRKAAALLPGDAAALNNLGSALLGLGHIDDAMTCIQDALAIAPDYPKAVNNLGIVLRLQGRWLESETQCKRAITLAPGYAQAHMALGNALELQNKLPQALDSYRTALQLNPQEVALHSDVLHLTSLDNWVTAADLSQAHRAFGAYFEPALQMQHHAHCNSRDPDRQLHIGFVTSDLYNHALANYLEPLFKGLAAKKSLELHLYYSGSVTDAITNRSKHAFAHWHDTAHLNDAQLAEQIRSDGIDILVDLNGHTYPNRLLTFARQPAPVQMSWIGYLGSTGLQAMDYYIADPWWLPSVPFAQQFSEKLAYLPCAMAFEPNPLAPPVNALPALSNGFVTFGSFNRLNKINPTVIATWSAVLRRLPTAKLVMGGIADTFQDDLRHQFASEGISPERLSFLPRAATHAYLAQHHQVDLCLDTFPFGGGATSAHAAWMGVPTVCWTGDKPASRFGAAQLHHLGLDDFIASDAREFIELACDWANRPQALADIRAGLRARFAGSSLCNYAGFADHFETLFRTVWQQWCMGQPATQTYIGNTMTDPSCETTADAEPSALAQQELHTLYQQHRDQEAEALARELIAKFPDHGLARKILGAALHRLGRFKESLLAHQATVQYRPGDFEAHFNLACELHQQGFLDDAVTSYVAALGLQPNNPNAYNNLGNIFKTMGLNADAELYCRQALALQPDMAKAHNNLGNALHAQGKHTEAAASYREALALHPDWAEALNNLAIVLKDMGDSQAAQVAYRAALQLKPDWAAAHSNLLFCLSLDVNTSPQELLAQHMAFGTTFGARANSLTLPHHNDKNPIRPLRVGFVSGDFYDHALANFFEPVFRALRHLPNLELHAYYTHVYEDAVTQRLRDCFSVWNQVPALTETDLAQKIHADGIDILFDLAGHSAHNRLLTFALKPAPIQVSYLGYLGTTGLAQMDYFLCDTAWLPPQLDWQLTEKPAYLPSAVVFQPSELAPPVNELPALTQGYVTLGSFNRPNKINAAVIMLWCMVLRQLPNARLVFGGMPQDSQDSLLQSFASEGIHTGRLTFFARANLPAYLALHHQVDFCLDTFPHGGGATTAHAAWMGVPSLCLAGETPASRLGAMEMQHLGLSSFVATSIEDYLDKAQHWATHLEELAQIRTGLRERFRHSPIGQYGSFAHNFESILRAMWQRWCADLPPTSIEVNVTKPSSQTLAIQTQDGTPPQTDLDALADLLDAQDYPAARALANRLTLTYTGNALAWTILASMDQAQERYAESIYLWRQALALDPGDAVAHNNVGMALVATNQADLALTHFQDAVRLDPHYGKARINLAFVQQYLGDLEAAQTNCQTAIAQDETHAGAHIQLGKVLEEMGQLSQAQACYYRADMAHEPRREVAHSNVLYLLNHDVLVTPQHLFEEHLAFGTRFEPPLLAQQYHHTPSDDPERVLHVGFVSGDFNFHALTDFLEPLFTQLAHRTSLVCHAFYTQNKEDAVTRRMRLLFTKWHAVAELDDAQLAERIHAEKIDILIDLAGHTAKNRLLTFARKPAPVQASWLGYLGTTGLKAMDYYISDAYWIPPGELDWQFVEKMAYLPSAVTFQPDASWPSVSPLPALSHGALTFGSFNRASKINASVISLWSMLLRSIPSSRLLLGAIEKDAHDALLQNFAAEGISATRLRFAPRMATPDYLALHHLVDICLDTYPHAGGATTASAAWMGVPTLGLAGQTPASRFGAALMHQLGLDDFVADSLQEFVHIGHYWSEHLNELGELRTSMRQRFSNAMLGQPAEFTVAFETLLRTMWRGWCDGAAAHNITVGERAVVSKNSLARVEPPPLAVPHLVVVSATKLSESDFWTTSALGLSLNRLYQQGETFNVDIAFQNTQGLPALFNAAIDRARSEDILVFVHDDVWLDDYHFSQTVAAGLQRFDVLGVAGNKRRLPQQTAWCFVDKKFTWDDKRQLSGQVSQGSNAFGIPSNYGPVPAACELLDGVFLATRKSCLTNSQVQFDPLFNFHFYDLDFCRTARQAGLTLGTWDIHITHQSGGAFGSPGWQVSYEHYLCKWEPPTCTHVDA